MIALGPSVVDHVEAGFCGIADDNGLLLLDLKDLQAKEKPDDGTK